MRAAPLVALAALLLVVPLAPGALADHLPAHRLYVEGRVVDAEGLPVARVPVNLSLPGLRDLGPCFDRKDDRTGPQGDFVLCRHVHALPEGLVALVEVQGVEAQARVFTELRWGHVNVQLPEVSRMRDLTGVREFNQTFRVVGRSYSLDAQPTNSDGVWVNATPMGQNVTVRLVADNETLAQQQARIDTYGRFEADLAVGEIPEGAQVRVEGSGVAQTLEADRLFRRADANIIRDDRLAGGPGADAPGSGSGRVPLPSWAPLAAVALAAALFRRGIYK